MADICRGSTNTLRPNQLFKIHPAIGIARIGNHPTAFFIGPELPNNPANPSGGFKNGGKIKRQAARFRIFDYGDKAKPKCVPREINLRTPEVLEIEWTVHLANRKASFFKFNGTAGEHSSFADAPYSGRASTPPTPALDIDDEPRRNAKVPVADRVSKLEIDAGPQTLKVDKGRIGLKTVGPAFANPKFPGIKIPTLGDMQADEDGNLVVLGGHGTSERSNSLPVPHKLSGAPLTPTSLYDYANNDTWFDDISDGTVKAKIRFNTGRVISAEAAWVLVGPPDFAPGIGNIVSLYDVLYDVALRLQPLPTHNPIYDEYDPADKGKGLKRFKDAKNLGLAAYKPSYADEIEPILKRAMKMKWVFDFTPTSDRSIHDGWDPADLSDPTRPNDMRQYLFHRLRKPGGGGAKMPKLLGDEAYTLTNPRFRLSVTETQYKMLEQWSKGRFVPGTPSSSAITPEGLDRAALENCVGGAFYPGIECGWLIRNKEIYAEPFRIKEGASIGIKFLEKDGTIHSGSLTVKPGFFSQQMALPWQADFNECHVEWPDGTPWGWWPAQRPDVVQVGSGTSIMKAWRRASPGTWIGGSSDDCSMNEMMDNYFKFGFVKEDPARPGEFLEDERNPTVP